MAEVLQVDNRDWTGKRRVRRQRAAGRIPAVLYGHGQEVVHLSAATADLAAAVRHGSQVVDLAGAVKETALIKEIQWDTFGQEMLHVDLARVSADERVAVTVALELRGDAPGIKQGGVVDQPVHEIEIECPAAAVTASLEVNINSLELDQSITVGELELPQGASLLVDADMVVVQCSEPAPELDEEEGEPAPAEPEVIGAKKEEGEGEES
ncbi:MAG: 50S ribosomal protein L25 [Planctomycetota bacterium]|nr:MAG: 50S ribosomal protein L25 [Planctomycetota bacterium]REK40983.1 MAG: 50S ribosomal protein L25 [Planctomycetota bacterium]